MKREERNQRVRAGLVDTFASTKLSQPLLEQHARLFEGLPQTPLDDVIHAAKVAGGDLMAAITEPGNAALYVKTEMAISLLLSIGLLRNAQPKLKDAKTDKEREERMRTVQAHGDAQKLSRLARTPGTTIEDFHSKLAGFDSPELVKRMLLSPTASSRVVTLDNKILEPIKLPTKKLNSQTAHRVRISVVEVSPNGTHASVKVVWAREPASVAVKDLFKRTVRLEYRRFKDVANLSDLLLSLRLARRQAEVIVTVTRALRPSDKDLDLLVLKEFCGLKELAVAVPDDVQRIQEELWSGLR